MRYLKYILIAALLLAVAFIAWGDERVEKRVVATIDPDGVQRVEVTGDTYYFDPNVIVVKVNVPVELRVKKAGGIAPHNIVIKAPDAGINIEESLSTEPKSIQFTPTKVGKYPFECTKRLLFFKSHKDRGMHGMLEVVE
jgi:plastocyanin domain-containing protein